MYTIIAQEQHINFIFADENAQYLGLLISYLENVSAKSTVSREAPPLAETHSSGGRPLGGSSPPRFTWWVTALDRLIRFSCSEATCCHG